ncbi:Fumitremorgin C synthase [Cyphellophora attinorum]|uniref:Fumitremorgin C synthase n=1 Tax=Cyphellophora attinorum TaxID=1664694 RepID=A0A0N0NJH4_9EURO|nr:Fumitremorgin C synthase [Phialophora attinorum]KPI36639.1 Fumitremorgin C synthase [Phialophora attinorum]
MQSLTSSVVGLLARLLTAALLLAAGAVAVDYARMLYRRRSLPPGPMPWPLFGNYFQTPKDRPWLEWEQWSKKYDSTMLTLWVGREPRIIINDAWDACELMEKRADIWSSRPHLIAMGDAINLTETNQTVLPYGDRWRLHRRLMHTAVGTQAVRSYKGFQADESKILTRDILEDPEDYVMSIERYSVSVTSIVGWGRRIDRKNDLIAQQALKLMEGVDLVIPGLYIIEALPWLCKLPRWLYKFPTDLWHGSAIGARFFWMLSKEGADAPEDNFAKRLILGQEKEGLTDLEVAGLAGNLLGGGVDTTTSTMLSCILAMCAFPDVQRKAQAEIDSVVGKDRSPSWEDIAENRLPYIEAIVKEALRWRTVTILAGIPHANTVDFDYKGYHFPAGTNVTANMWAIHRNPRDFPEPDVFRPERFLNGLERPYPNARGSNPFGFGRRSHLAFDMRPGLDQNGQEIKLDLFAYSASENIRPLPFKARFISRSEDISRLITDEAVRARDALRVYDGETRVTMAEAAKNPAYN